MPLGPGPRNTASPRGPAGLIDGDDVSPNAGIAVPEAGVGIGGREVARVIGASKQYAHYLKHDP